MNWPDSAPWMIRWSYVDETFMTRDTPRADMTSSGIAWNSAGYPIAPVAMIAPCPGMRRGRDDVVPIVPGFVSEIEVPANASGSIVPFRAFATSVSNAARNSPNAIVSAPLMFGTRRLREPSFFVMSIAIPRFTDGFRMRAGLPSTSPNASFIPGCFSRARTIAHATKCVKETFERPSASRWRFRIRRFSSMFLTGTTRFVVAVGTPSEASMFRAIVAAPPAIGMAVSPARAGGGAGRGAGGAAATGGGASTAPARAAAASGAMTRAGTLIA